MRPVDQFARTALPFGVDQNRNLNCVPVMCVVWNELEVPLQDAAVRVECDCGIGVQVVAGTNVTVPIRRRIANAPDDQVLRGVVGAGNPRWPSAPLPCIAAPRFVTFFTRSG